MDILKIIKKRTSIRRYQKKRIPRKTLEKIIEAGIWGPSIPSFLRIQPWRYLVITNKKKIMTISRICLQKSKKLGAGANILLHSGSDIIGGAVALILVYNSGEMNKIKNKFTLVYKNFSGIVENAVLSAISAAIQNMLLEAENLGIGTCWLDTPLFGKQEINKVSNINDELIAVITLGYPAEKGRRSPRKPLSEAVRYIK